MRKNPLMFINHILENIILIEKSINNLSRKDFGNNRDILDATIRRIEVIGEAAKNLSSEFTNKYRNIEWKKIIGMRDKMIHHYFGVDIEIIWKTINEDIPILKRELQEILEKEKIDDERRNLKNKKE